VLVGGPPEAVSPAPADALPLRISLAVLFFYLAGWPGVVFALVAAPVSAYVALLFFERLDGFVATHPIDQFYLTGTMQSGFLVVPAEGEAVFYVRRSVTRAIEESASVRVEALGSLKTWKERVAANTPSLAGACTLAADCPSYGTGPVDPVQAAALVKGPSRAFLLARAGIAEDAAPAPAPGDAP